MDAENIHHSTMQLSKQVRHYRSEIITAHHFPPGIKCGIYHKAGPQSTVSFFFKSSSDSIGGKKKKLSFDHLRQAQLIDAAEVKAASHN